MSIDGIHWVKHKKNPVFSFYCKTRDKIFCEFPSVCFTDSMAFLYYDNGSIAGEIGVATAKIAN
jgi:hypothetical protein